MNETLIKMLTSLLGNGNADLSNMLKNLTGNFDISKLLPMLMTNMNNNQQKKYSPIDMSEIFKNLNDVK